jgi:hypothetical protein
MYVCIKSSFLSALLSSWVLLVNDLCYWTDTIKLCNITVNEKNSKERKVWGICKIKNSEQSLHEVRAVLESNMTDGEENT